MKLVIARCWGLFLALAFVFSSPAFATQYYVSPNGNDNNDGLSASTPWQTINKVNSFAFSGGDTVSFQGGGTFTGCLVFNSANVQYSSALTPFTVNSYGTGVATIQSNCTGSTSAAVTIDNVNGFYLNSLKVVNGFATGAASTTAIGVLLENQSSNTPTQTIVVDNSEVTGFAPPSGSTGIGGEIVVIGYAMNSNNGPLNDIEVLNNILHGASVTAGDYCGVCGYGDGENITNVLIQGNTVYNLGNPAPYGALDADGVNGATIQYNLVHDIGANTTTCGGTSGIETYTSNNVTVRFNEVYNVQPTSNTQAKTFGGTGCDWDGIDLDGGTSNSVVEYNYTHHNGGNGLLAYDPNVGSDIWGNNTFRYNISENDDWTGVQGGLMDAVGGVPHKPLYIYNNTFFDNNTTEKSLATSSACFYFGYGGGTWASGSLVENNICYLNAQDKYGRNGQFIYNPYSQSGMTLSNNLYWTDYSAPWWHWGGTIYKSLTDWAAKGLETNPGLADPLLNEAGNGGTCNWTPSALTGPQSCPQAYTLQSGSPAISTGVDVANNGGRDYYNNSLTSPPSVGAYSTGSPIGGGGGGTPPEAPTNASASAITVSTVSLSWNEVLNATSYNVYRGTTSGFTPSSANLIAAGVAATPFTDSGLTHSTTYYYVVEAVNYAGSSGPSNQASVITPDQTNYYVSPTGNDGNSGTSTSSPWQTINKVNTFVFPEGAIVNFEGGQTFTGCLVANPTNVPNSSVSNPFTLQSYGTGMATIQSYCTGTGSSAITGDTINGFAVNGLKIVNGSQTLNGVLLENQHHASPVQNLVVENTEITGFAPVSGVSGGGAEIFVIGDAINGHNGPLNNVQILNNSLHGASVTSPDGPGIAGYGYGKNISNVLVQGNSIYDLGMEASSTYGALEADGWNGATIQYNVVHDIGANVTSCGGTAGIETYASNNITLRYNEVYNIQPSPSFTAGCDWDAIDLDGGTTNSVVEYNYTHSNYGPGLYAYTVNPSGSTWGPNTYRYNISENDGLLGVNGAAFGLQGYPPQNAMQIYGNTLVNTLPESGNSGDSAACFFFGLWNGGGAAGSGSMIEDNICDMNDPNSANNVEFVRTATNTISGIAFQNNLYYTTSSPEWIWNGTTYASFSSWEGAGVDSGSLFGDPLLNNPGNGGTCNWTPSALTGPQSCPQAYTLQSGSPASATGVDVSNNGGSDYYGNTVPSPPSIGAQAISSASTSSTLLTFSDSTVADYNPVPSTYQPVSGVTITWNGGGATTHRYGTHTYDGYQDHTQSVNASAPSIDIGTATGGSGLSNRASIDFSALVTIPSLYVTNWDWWEQDVILKGYTNVSDTTPVVTVTVPYTSIPNHPTGTTTGAWVQVTGLSGYPIQRLDIIGTKDSSTSQVGAALVDDMTINH